MALFGVPFDIMDESHIQNLLTSQVAESKIIEYKRELPGNSDSNKKEFLADVSSFANTSGGDILFGIDETGGIPTSIPGLTSGLDSEILRIESILQTGLQPRIPRIQSREIRLSSGVSVLHIRIPNSWISPHMVTFQNVSRFYSRNSAGKYQLDVSEIRNSILASESLSEKIRNFRTDRILKIIAEETPIPMERNPKVILHMIPINSFNQLSTVDFNRVSPTNSRPIYASSFSTRHNFDGLLLHSISTASGLSRSYLQIFRNGILEAVSANLVQERDGSKHIPSIRFEEELIESIQRFMNLLRIIGLDTPIILMLSLIGVKGAFMAVSRRLVGRDETYIDRDQLIAPEIIIEDYSENVQRSLHGTFDSIWNAAGWPRSINYDAQGNWVGHG